MCSEEKNKTNERITGIRNAIDDIDEKILHLINQRLDLAKEIGKVKAETGNNILDKSRETELLRRLCSLNQGPLRDNEIHYIFNDIITVSRELQKPLRVAYLGPPATFSHLAAMNHFGNIVSCVPQPGIHEIFSEVEKGSCYYGIVPVENSIEGAVNITLDLFFESDLKICAEQYQTISNDLLSIDGIIENIKVVYSHPQPFGQCRRWLKRNLPNAQLIECSSTAYAAQKASEEKGTAAISSSVAATIYNLKTVVSKIEDYPRNVTRFLIIGRDEVKRTGKDKTSIIFVTSHSPGALHKVLDPISKSNINLNKLESRPSKFENWNYFFIVDLDGHIADPILQETINNMRPLCLYLKWLGSYPKSKD
ncbi:MAG: prephenate dehydratase [Desulfobacterales bacterium]|nr:prephenate dehydratase [Desulfobacterales bacterium]